MPFVHRGFFYDFRGPAHHRRSDGGSLFVWRKTPMAIRDPQVARLNAEALRLRRSGLSYKEVGLRMGGISAERARLRALRGLRDDAKRRGKRHYRLDHDTYLNWGE
jgi:hypothetical protein